MLTFFIIARDFSVLYTELPWLLIESKKNRSDSRATKFLKYWEPEQHIWFYY